MWHLPPSLPVGPAALPTLPLAILAALLAWPPAAARFARQWGLDEESVSGWMTGLTAAVLIGSRLSLVVAYPGDFLATPRALLTAGGPVASWGAAAGLAAGCGWALWRHRPAWRWLEAALAGLPSALAVVAAGWPDPGALPALLGLLAAALVLRSAAASAAREDGVRPGQTGLAAVLLLAITGFALPWFRVAGPGAAAWWLGWTGSQWAWLLAAAGSGLGLWRLGRQPAPVTPDSGPGIQ